MTSHKTTITAFDEESTRYFRKNARGISVPNRHWAIVGEIKQTPIFSSHRMEIQSLFEETIIVHFRPEVDLSEKLRKDMKENNTVIIFYAQKEGSWAGSPVVRPADVDSVMMFPADVETLNDEYTHIKEQTQRTAKVCIKCRIHQQDCREKKMWHCTNCKTVLYCGRKCQALHWKESHRLLCPYTRMLSGMAKLDFSIFNDFVSWKSLVRANDTFDESAQSPTGAIRFPILQSFLNSTRSQNTDDINRLLVMMSNDKRPFYDGKLGDSLLYSALSKLCNDVSDRKSPSGSHYFVVDDLHERNEDSVLVTVPKLLASRLPHPLVLAMELEAHYEGFAENLLFHHYGTEWRVSSFLDSSYILKHLRIGIVAILSVHHRVIANFGSQLARDRQVANVIRVFRCIPHPNNKQSYLATATEHVPSNVYDIWIRHRRFETGGVESLDFLNELSSKKDLLTTILDVKDPHTDGAPSDMLKFLQTMALMKMFDNEDNYHNMWRDDMYDTDDDDDDGNNNKETRGGITQNAVRCAACRRKKPASAFSKNQRRKTNSRCRSCVNKDQPCSF